MSDPIVALWTAQQADARAPSPATLADRSRQMRRRTALRDAREHIAGVLVALAFAFIALTDADWGVRLASIAIIIGVVTVSTFIWRHRQRDDPVALGRDALGYYRAQLITQRDMLANVGRWYLGPLVPGLVLFVGAIARTTAGRPA